MAALCSVVFLTATRLRWPPETDTFARLRISLAGLEAQMPQDSSIAIRIEGLSDDHFNYVRYCLIPRPLELSLPRTRRMILLAAPETADRAFERMRRQRPDLQCVTRIREADFCLALFKSSL